MLGSFSDTRGWSGGAGGTGADSAVAVRSITMSSLCGSDGTTWAEDDLTTPSSIATLSRSRRTSSPHDPSSDAFLLRDDLETLSLLLCMAPSRI